MNRPRVRSASQSGQPSIRQGQSVREGMEGVEVIPVVCSWLDSITIEPVWATVTSGEWCVAQHRNSNVPVYQSTTHLADLTIKLQLDKNIILQPRLFRRKLKSYISLNFILYLWGGNLIFGETEFAELKFIATCWVLRGARLEREVISLNLLWWRHCSHQSARQPGISSRLEWCLLLSNRKKCVR